ncbi:MAG: beta-propeller domain-containing protein [Clostridiales Family XIII bacterium]|jgi:uncharacterized secreted protein with C-terminal beta-propeller domain|nr:beta-propeller domain-containing protein [Clostridiales Family XIII bacterium]
MNDKKNIDGEGLVRALKELTEAEPPKLDFYEGFDADIPSAGEMFESIGKRAGAVIEEEERERKRFGRFVWITSGSLAAAIAIILFVTTVYQPGMFSGGGFGNPQSNENAEIVARDAVPDNDSASGLVSGANVMPAELPAQQSGYEAIYDAVSPFVNGAGNGSELDRGFYGEAEASPAPDIAPAPAEASPAPEIAPAPTEASPAPADESADVGTRDTDVITEAPAAVQAPEEASPAPAPTYADEFSDTNVQTEGVQEADVVKTDGRYIYTANSEGICITEANDGHPEVLSEIKQVMDQGQVYFEMYINGDTLTLVRNGYSNLKGKAYVDENYINNGNIDYVGEGYRIDTSVDIYDVSDRENPRKVKSLSQSGSYTDSRMIGDKLYLLSSYGIYGYGAIDEDDPRTYVPLFAEGSEQIVSKPSDIAVPPEIETSEYMVISGIDTSKAEFVSHKSLLGRTYTVYASKKNLYLTEDKYETKNVRMKGEDTYYPYYYGFTRITRLSLEGGKVKAEASADVIGLVDDQFSMDENGGYLRVVTTTSDDRRERTTGLFVLDMDMKQVGAVKDLAPGEQVYSCRYIGDVAYFVTFRNTDPLFSVDLRDPKKPKVMGELKITDFSEYLHPYSDGLLFGLGQDADEDGDVRGLKISMFDNSDPYDVKEKDKLVLQSLDYSYAAENHKAILVDERKSIIAFPADDSYVIIKYSAKSGFRRVMAVRLEIGDDYGDMYEWYGGLRGLFIGDVFYVIAPDSIHTYDMKDGFKAIDSVSLGSGAAYVHSESYEFPEWAEPDEADISPIREFYFEDF